MRAPSLWRRPAATDSGGQSKADGCRPRTEVGVWLWVGTRPRVLWEEPGCGPAAPSGVLRDSKQPLRFRRSMPGRPHPSGPARVRTREIRAWVILFSGEPPWNWGGVSVRKPEFG